MGIYPYLPSMKAVYQKQQVVSKLLERNAPINDCPISSLADRPDFCFAMDRKAFDAE